MCVALRLSPLPHYYVPKIGPLSSYREYITMLPAADHPEAFGQHSNADIASQIQETRLLFDTLLSLQPQVAATAGDSKEDKVQHGRVGSLYPIHTLRGFFFQREIQHQLEIHLTAERYTHKTNRS